MGRWEIVVDVVLDVSPAWTRVATVLPEAGPQRVLPSGEAGLREMLLLAQDACSDALCARAGAAGVPLPSHDVASRLTETVRSGGRMAPVLSRRAIRSIRILVEGEFVLALPRRASSRA